MKCPPYLVSMRVMEGERRKFRLWLPLFLLWPLLSIVLLLTLMVALLADAACKASGQRAGYTRLLFGCLGVVGETRGTEVFIQPKNPTSRTVAFSVL
jgi:hypothetical protein